MAHLVGGSSGDEFMGELGLVGCADDLLTWDSSATDICGVHISIYSLDRMPPWSL